MKLTYAVEPEPLDTAGAIRFAARHVGIDERFLAVNGDVLTDLDVSALVAFHDERGAEATIHLTHVDDPSRFGVVPTDDDGRVVAFVEKPEPGRGAHSLHQCGHLRAGAVGARSHPCWPSGQNLRRTELRLQVSAAFEAFDHHLHAFLNQRDDLVHLFLPFDGHTDDAIVLFVGVEQARQAHGRCHERRTLMGLRKVFG